MTSNQRRDRIDADPDRLNVPLLEFRMRPDIENLNGLAGFAYRFELLRMDCFHRVLLRNKSRRTRERVNPGLGFAVQILRRFRRNGSSEKAAHFFGTERSRLSC